VEEYLDSGKIDGTIASIQCKDRVGSKHMPETLFSIANAAALSGWIALLFAPFAPKTIDLFAGWGLPAILSLGYSIIILVHFADAPGGFQTLADVQLLFSDANVALGGWIHYLAFDLFIGAWVVRDARNHGIPHWCVVPILPFVFLLGPFGLLAYLCLRLVLKAAPRFTEARAA
jgi:hypothetical protein